MRKYFWSLLVAAPFIAPAVYGLPAPSSLSSREKRAVAPRATPTPVAQRRAVTVSEADRPSTVVVIDAGHGGFDRGGIPGQRVAEKTMTLDVAQRLEEVLTAYGYRVVMTRDSDVFVPLGTRVAIANSYRNAIFVCIHFNAARRGRSSGIETYFYSSQSLPLASAIHYYVAGGAPSVNRGVRRRGFFVLRKTTIPSVLVECGFLTNPAEAQYALSSAYRQKLALEIAHGIQNRASVSRIAGATRIVSSSSSSALEPETVPLQPFIDQTHYRDPDLVRSKHRRGSKSSKSTSSNRKKSSDSDSESDSPQKKLKALREATPKSGDTIDRAPYTIVLDGLLGTGAKSFLREPLRTATREINRLRREENAFVFAIDLPTGLDADSGEHDPEDSVVADFTLTIGFAKHGLIVDSALNFVGRIQIVPLPGLWPEGGAPNELAASPYSLSPLLPRRRFSAYKNEFGRIGVVAGSKGFVGAALMTTEGALRAGAGLVEVFVPEEIYEIVASAAPVE